MLTLLGEKTLAPLTHLRAKKLKNIGNIRRKIDKTQGT
jgi:hypothetical protein